MNTGSSEHVMLTDRQEEILAFIGDHQRQNTVPPSARGII
ncbi:MAG: hypothetical protein U1F61_20105 [Opitutaceae bacterium]